MPGGWAGSDRRSQLPPDWPIIRTHVLERDGHQCRAIRIDTGQRCEQPATDVDHQDNPSDHRPEALVALCSWHHDRKSSAEGHAAKRFRYWKPSEKHPTEAHPGLL